MPDTSTHPTPDRRGGRPLPRESTCPSSRAPSPKVHRSAFKITTKPCVSRRCSRMLLRTSVNKLARMLATLARGGVEFVLVGGYAAVAHGVTLVTQDVDICCRFTKENLFRLQAVLAELHPRHRMTPQKLPLELTDELCARLNNLYLETDLCMLDCLS